MTFKSLNKLFFDRAEQYNEKPFLWAKKNKEWIPINPPVIKSYNKPYKIIRMLETS